MSVLFEYLTVEHVRDLSAETKGEALSELCDILAGTPAVVNRDGFLQAIIRRERVMSTGIGNGIAIPHARTHAVSGFVVAVGRIGNGIEFEALDGLPVQVIILMGAPERKKAEFLDLIAEIGSIFSEPGFLQRFLEAGTPEEMFRLLVRGAGARNGTQSR